MAFMLFKKQGMLYLNANQTYKLAGNTGLLHKLWNKRKLIAECGWSVTADDLLKELSPSVSSNNSALLIDFHPGAKDHIELVEIEKIHVYTHKNGTDGQGFSVIMLEMSGVHEMEDSNKLLTGERKQELLSRFEWPTEREKIIEFLYLQENWNWGKNGYTNGAFIFNNARKFFQSVFSN
jgi:hypothetical protein